MMRLADGVHTMRQVFVNISFVLLLMLLSYSVGAKEKVVYFYNWPGSNLSEQMFLDLISEFEHQHPHIEVELIRGGGAAGQTALTRLVTLILSDISPDVVHFERSTIVEFAAKGLLRPLNLDMEIIKQAYIPGAIQEVVYNGHLYGLPWSTDIRGLFWNQGDFNETGLNKNQGPETIEELDEMARKLTRTNAVGGFDRLGFVPWRGNWNAPGWLYAFGGAIYDPDSMKPRVDTENHRRAFEWIEGYAMRYPNADVSATFRGKSINSFYEGALSMVASWNGFARSIEAVDPTIEFWAGEVPHPDYGTNGTWMGGYSHVIPSNAKNPDAAMTLLMWLSSDEAEVERFRQGGGLPTRWSALTKISHELSPTDAILANQTNVAWGRPPLWHPPFITALNEAQSKVVSLSASPKEALDEAQRLLEVEFEEVLRAGK